MKAVYTAAEMRAGDAAIIEGLGLPGIALMEAAAAGVADRLFEGWAEAMASGVVIACGPGNNGGDGYAVARRLRARGVDVAVWPVHDALSGDAATMQAVASKAGVPTTSGLGRPGLIVDALFGTGLARPLDGRFAEVVRALRDHEAPVVAVDLPSGLCADTGRVWGEVAPAAMTVTLGGLKRGLCTGPGRAVAGRVEVVDLGLTGAAQVGAQWVERSDVAACWPRRSPSDHKTRSGHLWVIAGSRAMAGAAVLAARGALAGGAGLVTVVVPEGAVARLSALPPEVMVWVSGEGSLWAGALPEDLGARCDGLVVGPGLGAGAPLIPAASAALQRLHDRFEGPMLVDADALAEVRGPGAGPRLRTPHPGEAARLLSVPVSEVAGDRFGALARLRGDGVPTLLKGPFTLVGGADGPVRVNPTGNPVLATGGTGDVLAGLAGALMVRGLSPVDAGMAAAWVHGAAADRLASERPEGWTAADVAAEIGPVVGDLLEGAS